MSRKSRNSAGSATPTALPHPNRRRNAQRERATQAAIVEYHSLAVINPASAILFAVPNGERRDEATAALLTGMSSAKRHFIEQNLPPEEMLRPHGQGVLPGAVDLVLLTQGATDLIEVKRPEIRLGKLLVSAAGNLSRRQKIFREAAVALQHNHHVMESVEEYVTLLQARGVRLRFLHFLSTQ